MKYSLENQTACYQNIQKTTSLIFSYQFLFDRFLKTYRYIIHHIFFYFRCTIIVFQMSLNNEHWLTSIGFLHINQNIQQLPPQTKLKFHNFWNIFFILHTDGIVFNTLYRVELKHRYIHSNAPYSLSFIWLKSIRQYFSQLRSTSR